MKFEFWLVLAFACCVSAQAFINEIFYDPLGSDNNLEFVEIKGTDNLSGFLIGDTDSNDSLEMLSFFPGNFSLIVEEGFNYSGINASIYSVGATIGDNLNNDADCVYLYFNNSAIDFVCYNNSCGSGYSLEYYNGSWIESLVFNGTPGFENSWSFVNYSGEDNVTINETNNQSVNISVNETINQTVDDDYCSVSIGLSAEKQVYESGEKIEFYNSLSEKGHSFEIEYWIEDVYGDILKKNVVTANTNKKSYTPKIDEKEKILFIKNRIISLDCENINNNTDSSMLLAVYNLGYEDKECSEQEDCEIVECEEEKGVVINNIYIRNKNFADNIKLYVSLSGEGLADLVLWSWTEKQKIELQINGSKTVSFNVTLLKGSNPFLLTVKIGNKILDAGRIIIQAEDTLSIVDEYVPLPASEELVEEKEDLEVKEKNVTVQPAVAITGMAGEELVYESGNEKVKKYLNYGLVIVIVAGLSIFLKAKIDERKRNKTKNRRGMGSEQGSLRDDWEAS